jgi:hypothetical protein
MTPAMPRPVVEGGHGRHAFGPSSSSSVSTMQIAAPTAVMNGFGCCSAGSLILRPIDYG